MEKIMDESVSYGTLKAKAMKGLLLFVMSAFLFCSAEREAFSMDAEALCPSEKFDAVTVQGIYLGWQLPHTPEGTITVRLRDSHVPLHILASETRARSLFERKYNAIVEVTYDFIQTFDKKEERCRQYYVLKTGKIITEQKKSKFFH